MGVKSRARRHEQRARSRALVPVSDVVTDQSIEDLKQEHARRAQEIRNARAAAQEAADAQGSTTSGAINQRIAEQQATRGEEIATNRLGHATNLKGSGYNLTDDALDDMAKKLGIGDAEAAVIKQKFKAQYSYDNLQSNINNATRDVQSKIDNIKNAGPKAIEATEAAMKGLDANSADYKKLSAKLEGLKNGTGALEDSISRIKDKGGEALSRQKGTLDAANAAYDNVKKVVGDGIDDAERAFKKQMGKHTKGGVFSMKGIGGKLLVGGAVTYGLVQMLSDNKGQMQNSQLYSPGGPGY